MLKRVLHTGVRVTNLNSAIKLYESVGFKITRRFDNPEPKPQAAFISGNGATFEL